MHSICFENKNPVRISYEYGTFQLVGNPQIYLGAKQKVINITLEFSYYKLLHPPNKFGGYAQVTPLEFFSRP